MKSVPDILTLQEASDEARISKNTLKAHIKAGHLPAANLGLKKRQFWRIRRADLLDWMDRMATS